MTTRTVTKVLAAQEDLLLGQGETTQTRQGELVTVKRMDLPWVFQTIAQISALDTSKYNHCIYDNGTVQRLYRYDATSTETADDVSYIDPDTGVGQWVLVRPQDILVSDNGESLALDQAIARRPVYFTSLESLRLSSYSGDSCTVVRAVPGGPVVNMHMRKDGTGTPSTAGNIFSDLAGDILCNAGTHCYKLAPRQEINSMLFGAPRDGVSTDSTAINLACSYVGTHGGGDVWLDGAHYVTVTKGTNDKWGALIRHSKVTLRGRNGASLLRLDPDISTYAKAFPVLMIGVPDSNDSADQIRKVRVKDVQFTGNNTRHSTSGSALMDGRQAVWVKNAKNVRFNNCGCDNIDSSAIYLQSPSQYDYENNEYYNLTKCYDVKVVNCDFEAEEHATAGRALLHAIVANGDNVSVLHCDFEWCDDAVTCSTTYDEYDDVETDTYTDSDLGVAVKRRGRGFVFNGNTIRNSSEHAFYLSGMGVGCTNNTIIVDNPTVCSEVQIQIRGRGVSCTGNALIGVARAASINAGAMDVVWHNVVAAVGDSSGGIINIQSQGVSAYIDAREAFGSYKPMQNISVGGVITMPEAAQTNGVGIRVYTDTTDANYPNGQMVNVKIDATINNPRMAFLFRSPMARNINLDGSVLNGKPFTESGFSTSTTMNSLCALAVPDSMTTPLQYVSLDNCKIRGFEYILYDDGGAGGAGTIYAPYGIRGNKFDYIKYWDTAAFIAPTQLNMFTGNNGQRFLDRTGWFQAWSIHNALSDGNSGSEKKSMLQLASSSDVRIYHDDADGYKAL